MKFPCFCKRKILTKPKATTANSNYNINCVYLKPVKFKQPMQVVDLNSYDATLTYM